MADSEMHRQIFGEKFEAYCDKWVRLLNLGNWAIDYEMGDVVGGDGTIEAQCNVNTHLGHAAIIRFASRMGFEDERMRENLVIHEHLHIILDELGQFVYQHLPGAHHDYFTRLVEIAVSDLARVLVSIDEVKETYETQP